MCAISGLKKLATGMQNRPRSMRSIGENHGCSYNLRKLKYIYEVDKHVHLMEMTFNDSIKKWTPYNQLVNYI